MKNYILRMLSGVAILAATVVAVSVNAANGGIKETREYPVCYGDTLRLGDKVITRDTIWRDTMHSYEPGQDSVYVYVVHFGPMPAIQTESQVLAVGSSFMWHGLLVDHPGDYLKVYKSKSGCDSVLYKLTVTPEYASTYYYVEKDTTICEGESVMWRGAGRTISRTYVDTAHATLPQEQDTIYVLYLHVAKPFYQTEMMETSQFPFTYRGETFDAAGSRDVTYTSAAGCDSTYHIIVNQQQLTKHEYATICANDDQGYTWDRTHETYFEPSTYYHRIPSEYDPSKDSIVYVLHLSVAHTPTTTINETICFGETYYLNGKPYKTTGQYKQSLKTVDNCDSLVVLNLTVNYPIVHDTVKVTYNGVGAYQWKFNHEGDPQNVACNGSGIYERRLTNSTTGCEDIYILKLDVDSMTYHFRDTLTICEGEAFEWQGYTNLSSLHVGEPYFDYEKGYKTATGKDSVYHLRLTVLPIQKDTIGIVMFHSFPASFLGQTVTGPGAYTATITAASGCDSLVTFTAQRIVVKDSIHAVICEGEKYPWRGHDYDMANTYYEIEPAQDGSDSVRHILTLEVLPNSIQHVYKQLCQGDSYTANHKTYTQTGVFYDTMNAVNGCDSVVVYHLNFLSKDTVTIVRTKAEGDTVMCWGKEFTTPTLFDSVFINSHGCDSIVRLVVMAAAHIDTIKEEATICHGEHFAWHNNAYSTAGKYTHLDTTVTGVVSYHELTLKVNGVNKVYRPIDTTLCQGESFVYFDSVYTKPGTYLYPYNCDTIDSIVVKVRPVGVHVTNATIGEAGSYTWRKKDSGMSQDTVITEPGTYRKVFPNASGCEDIYLLYLSLDTNSYHYEEVATKCYGEPMIWHGQDLTNYNVGTHDTIYYITKTILGKDSIHHLTLTVKPIYDTTIVVDFTKFPATYMGLHFDAPGTQVLDLKTAAGCDSTITVIAQKTVLKQEEYATICPGEVYDWHENHYNAAGMYIFSDTTLSGDTIDYVLYLSMVQNQDSLVNASICRGDQFIFGGQSYTDAGVYTYNYFKDGCPAKAILTLQLKDITASVDNRVIRKDSTLQWNGADYNEEGDYDYRTTGVNGCDSVVTLHLRFLREDTIYKADTVCSSALPYVWYGNSYTTPGKKEWIETTPEGDITYYILDLGVREDVVKDLRYSICMGESVNINGNDYSSDTVFTFAHTCDTTYRVTISVNPSLLKESEKTFDGSSYHWSVPGTPIDTTLTKAGTYYKYVHNETTGCNDTYRLILREIKPDEATYLFDEKMTVCEGEDFTWQGASRQEWSHQGVGQTKDYYVPYTTMYGKDSIYHLALTVRPVPVVTHRIPFCDSLLWDNQWIKKDTILNDTFKTAFGCDSIVETILQKGSAFRKHEYDSIAPGESLTWHGKTITTDGIHEDIHHSVLGCDSSYILHINYKQEIPQIKTRTERVSICEGDAYEWLQKPGHYYYETGLYYDTIGTAPDIDSIIILNLTVNKSYEFTESVTFPASQFPVTYRGHRFAKPDTANIRYISSMGCDSIIKVIVNYQHTTYKETVTICAGDKYPWFNQDLREAGIYTHRLLGKNNKDSVTYILDLKVKYIPVTRIDSTICSGDAVSFGGQTLSESGSYEHTFKSEGCDSTVILTLHVMEPEVKTTMKQMNPGDAAFSWHNQTIDTTGIYYHYGTNAYGCQTTEILIVTVNHVDTIDHKAHVCPNAVPYEWHGISESKTGVYMRADTIDAHTWKLYRLDLTVDTMVWLDTTLTICPGTSTVFHGVEYSAPGIYENMYNHCDTAYRVHIQQISPEFNITHASLNKTEAGFPWSFPRYENGQWIMKDSIFAEPGTYEYTKPNDATGCNDIWRLYLTKDENEYHRVDSVYLCDGDPFDRMYHVGENIYTEVHETRTGNDSIYELHVFVGKRVYTDRWETFCGSFSWKGKTYNSTTVLNDTLLSLQYGCDSIVRYHYSKIETRYDNRTYTLVQGEELQWFDQRIITDGTYYHTIKSKTNDCDSIVYRLDVTVEAAAPQSPQFTKIESICDGDAYPWRGKTYTPTASQTYVDTVWTDNTKQKIDSIYVLKLTVYPSYKDTFIEHHYVCNGGTAWYHDREITKDSTFDTTFVTIHKCDSIVRVHYHFSDGYRQTDTICLYDFDAPYIWPACPDSSFTAADAGIHTYIKQVPGKCPIEYELVVKPKFMYQKDTTICETKLPFDWTVNGQLIKAGISQIAGTTQTWDITKHGANDCLDSLYRLNLTVSEVPKRTIVYDFCEGETVDIPGLSKSTSGLTLDSIYRDTIFRSSDANNACDSIIYLEYTQHRVQKHYEAIILHEGESAVMWHEKPYTAQGWYEDTIKTSNPHECYRIDYLHVVKEIPQTKDVCRLDTSKTPEQFKWRDLDLRDKPAGIYTDTTYDDRGLIDGYYTLNFTVKEPVVKTIEVRECKPFNQPYIWPVNGQPYYGDTVFADTLQCDTIFMVRLRLDTSYHYVVYDTICEHQLPYILGNGTKKDSVYSNQPRQFKYETTYGCDSIIDLHLTIVPELKKDRDSIFVCHSFFKDSVITLGDTIHPAFDPYREKVSEWEGKWHGVQFDHDTIVYNCDTTKWFHIIEHPEQTEILHKNFFLCPDDSLQLFWPHDTTWFFHDTTYVEHTPMDTMWTDETHGYTYNDYRYLCDSITYWHIKKLPLYHKDTTAHILQGDSLWWAGFYRYDSGTYDSIAPSPDTSSLGDTCMYIYPLHLIVDTAYHFRDTISLCSDTAKSYKHVWADGYEQDFRVGNKDTIYRHYIDTLHTATSPERPLQHDSIYDLCVSYTIIQHKHIYDTICEGDSIQFDKHRIAANNATQVETRFVKVYGDYTDTLKAINGCDSIVTLHLKVRNKVINSHQTVHIADSVAPYAWTHKWYDASSPQGRDSVRYLIAAGEYEFKTKDINGCDSIDSLTLYIHKNYKIQEDTIIICHDQVPYKWQDRNDITTSNMYYFNTRTKDGWGDSIRYVYIKVLPVLKTTIIDSLCYGDSIQFGLTKSNKPRWIDSTGVYYDTLQSIQHGCDSIIELRLNVFQRYFNTHTEHISVADTPFVWRHYQGGQKIDSTVIRLSGGQTAGYTYTFTSAHGCDSIDSLTLHVHQTYLFRDTVTICADQTPYSWEGIKDIYTTDNYIKHLVTHDGYDSIHVRRVIVLPVLKKTIVDTICEGDSLRFGLTKSNKPRFLTHPGVYYDTLTSYQYGCDSIITLHLNVYPNHRNYQLVDIADNKLPYEWKHIQGGNVISTENLYADGEYVYHFTSVFGCDSVDSLSLRVHKTYRIKEDTIDICSDATPYTWCDKDNITTSDDYTFYGQTVEGYDSIRTVHINVWPVQYTTILDTICEGDSLRFGLSKLNQPRFLKDAGTYYDTLTTAHGCDSIITLHLNVYPNHRNYSVEHIADNKLPFEWKHIQGGNVISTENLYADGEYVYHFTSIFGCDSVDSLSLRVHKTYMIKEDTIDLCYDQVPYTWCDKDNITKTDDYTYYGFTTEGYDSIRTVHINVWPVQYTTLSAARCDGDGYRFDSLGVERWLYKQGTYYDTLKTAHGCDSIIVLNLTVHPLYHNIIYRSIYEGDTVKFNGVPYTEPGYYPITYTSKVTGCDSIVELRLSVNKLYDDSVSVCYNALPFVWRGKTIYESGVYRDTVMNNAGEKTVTGLKVVVLPIARLETPIHDTICEGDFFELHGQRYYEGGTYYDTLVAQNGCDSIVTIVLHVQPVKYISENKTIFDGDSILFYDGTWKKTSGIYNYTEKVANGKCSDIYQLILTVVKPIELDTTVTVCENELPFIWRGREYNKEDAYTIPISWTDSTRITMTMNLKINPVPRQDRIVDICEGSTYIYKGREYQTNSIFYDTIPSTEGCDSIIKHIVRVHPTYDRIDTVHISDKQPYTFHDRVLTSSGYYEWTGKTNAYGCDSMEHLVLIVHPSYFFTDTVDLCQPDTLDWHGLKIMQSGTYSDSLLTSPYGFDSVYQVVVYVHPSFFIREQYEIGDGEVLKIHGRDISQPAIYFDTLRTIHGCDSIFHVVVNQKRTREFTWTREICQGESYPFFGRNLTHTGQYKYTSQYKDSVVTLNLTVNPISITEKRVVITDKQVPYVFEGQIYTQGGVYNDTLVNRYGCDSILRLVLVVSSHYSDWTPIPLCPGSVLKIDGEIITEAGLYTFLRRSRETGEMDSIYRVEVYDAPSFEFDVARTICQGDTVYFGDKAITRGGHHDIRLKTTEGCDSIYHLDLTVNPSYYFITDTTITDYQTVIWRGRTYKTSGDYSMSWPTVNDCDSTYTLSLHVVPTTRDTLTETICNGQSYTWRGNTYDMDGFYTDTIWMPKANFSAIYSLRLIIAYPTNILSATTGDICADATGFDIYFEYAGQKPSYYSVYFDALAKREGFVDIINAPLYGEMVAHIDMPQFASIAYETHPYYVRPDYYTMHIALDNGVCGVSRSDSVTLLVKYPSWIIEQNWNDVVIPLKSEYNGGYEFAQMEWFVNGVPQQNATSGYLYNPALLKGDQVVMKATRKGEKYAIPTCPLVITDPITTGNDVPVIVYPTQAPRHAPVVTVEAPHDGTYEIFSSTGMIISSGTLEEGATKVTLPMTSGIYFIRAHQGNEVSSHKVLLY